MGGEWVDVGAADEVADGSVVGVSAHGFRVALFRVGDEYAALWSRCPHSGGPLEEGMFRDGVVTCPWHASRFRVTDGERLGGPAATGATAFAVRVDDGRVLVGPPPPGTEPPPPQLSDLFG